MKQYNIPSTQVQLVPSERYTCSALACDSNEQWTREKYVDFALDCKFVAHPFFNQYHYLSITFLAA